MIATCYPVYSYAEYTCVSSNTACGSVVCYTQTTTNSVVTVEYNYDYISPSRYNEYDDGIWKLPNNIPKTSNKPVKPKMPIVHNFIRCVAPERMRQYRCQMRNK
jgi:chitinase